MSNTKYVKSSISDSDFSQRIRQQYRQKIQGIEKVYVPYYELNVLATFSNGSTPYRASFHCDAILMTVHQLPEDYNEPQLMDRSVGTIFPEKYDEGDVRNRIREHVVSVLPRDSEQEDGSFNLSIECSGRYYFPFWVAYFQGSRPDLFELMVFDPVTGKATKTGKEIVTKGFILLEESKADLPPWF